MPIEINDEENGGQQAEEGMQQCIGDIEEIRRGIRSQISRVERQRQAKNEQNPVQAATATATIGISTHVQFELPFLPDRDARALPYRTPLGDCKAVLYAPQHFNALGDSFFFVTHRVQARKVKGREIFLTSFALVPLNFNVNPILPRCSFD